MKFSIISENYQVSSTSFTCVDNSEPLYSKADYEPTSSADPIVWEATDGSIKGVGSIADNGDLCVSKEFAELVMSFDPFGIECYPAELRLLDAVLKNRYLLALNNVIDVLDESKSRTRKSPKRNKILIMDLYLSEEKLLNTPFHKRVLFRVKGAETATIFCEEIYDLARKNSLFEDLRMFKLDCDQEVPKY
ncbi:MULTISPECIES: hypothetical protein [Vibrio]|uniref:hypothetical protein n=1 Tax=Vibrio TaxID=662 RepID=UPI002074B1FA|nr:MULTISPECIES: hypothetical protein [Vibrio]USD31537.1 hypothetical protein J8Z27_09635 [Vibrio sp. SCSIO 43186]USD44581.1 hypothetical protein J4N38_10020 [Vibrio sp. SCSIO 43145]USD68660.1 hypothetical protein J4N41_09635 [Vibrio sp. SCSIO 43139]USD96350.1 hypothetical protein CTT30_09765 [Vibrio coralliilyticus]